MKRKPSSTLLTPPPGPGFHRRPPVCQQLAEERRCADELPQRLAGAERQLAELRALQKP